MVKGFNLYPFTGFDVAALTLQHDKAVALAEGAKNVRALMSGRGHGKVAVGVAGQQAALEVEAAWGFFQPIGGAYAQARSLRGVAARTQFGQQRLHQLIEGERRGDRVTRQTAEPAMA